MAKRAAVAAAAEPCLSASEARAKLPEALNRVFYGGERVRIGKRGKPLAALVSIEDLELLERLEDESDVRAAKKALREPGGVPWSKVRKTWGL